MQCGLCAVVAGLFRRAMCIAGSRRGSGESCYQVLATDAHAQPGALAVEQRTVGLAVGDGDDARLDATRHAERPLERRTTEVTVDSQEQNAVFVRISENAALASSGTSASLPERKDEDVLREASETATSASRRLSDTDRLLLEGLDVARCRTRHTGRFLTMHKRRRKRLTTRSLIQEPGILDDIFHGMVQCVLLRAGNWRFNAFTLETVTGGRSLPVLCVHLFHWYGLLQHFNLDVVTVWKLFAFIEEGYHSTNPYHNSIHATDVTQAMHCFLQEEKIRTHLTNLEIMASLIAAVTHDLDHPGVNQPFLVATSNHLAALYQNTSVLENHHWRSAIGCLLESGVSEQLPAEVRPELQQHISSLILATDITRQQEFLTRFKHYLDESLLDMRRAEDRHFILQIALKCADISNPCRPWDISRKWSYKVCEEFFRQGDYERQLNLPVTPLCDRHATSIPKIQAGFFKFVVTPLYEEWHRFLGDGLSVSLMGHLRANQKKWEALIAQEKAEETVTEMSELAEQEDDASSVEVEEEEDEEDEEDEEEEAAGDEDSGSIDLLIPAAFISGRRTSLPGRSGQERVGRRHSVPISVTRPLALFSRGSERRESLPNEHGKARNPLARLDSQSLVDPAAGSLSLLSSRSSVPESSANASTERPVSAENLLPEPSIASITSSTEASRLCTVLQPDVVARPAQQQQTKQLTRQQTFPPLQPYARMRYMSTTAEMSRCHAQVLVEADSSSSGSASPARDASCSGGRCGTPPTADAGARRIGELLAVDYAAKTRAPGLGRRTEPNSSAEQPQQQPRRHSVQTARGEEPKPRVKRPSSAQESDTARAFYSALAGTCAAEREPESFNESLDDSFNESLNESLNESFNESLADSFADGFGETREGSDSESRRAAMSSDECRTKKFEGRRDARGWSKRENEPRRHSTPVGECATTGSAVAVAANAASDGAGRRFTAIPVSSELTGHKVFFIGSPPDSPPRVHAAADVSGECVSLGAKRDSDTVREKVSKIAKLSADEQRKENVDPRTVDESGKGLAPSRKGSQGWARRRGSAPVGLLSRLDDLAALSSAPRADQNSRRGSVPTDIARHQVAGFNRLALGPRGENLPARRRASLPQETTLRSLLGNVLSLTMERDNCAANNNTTAAGNNNNNNNNNPSGGNNNGLARVPDGSVAVAGMPSPRRGSVPADISELRRDLFNRSSANGKQRNRKKVLRRRSSGGPEMFAGGSTDGNDNGTWLAWKRELAKRDSIPEPVVKRRGSLPIDVVAVSHAGTASGARRSSLWRL